MKRKIFVTTGTRSEYGLLRSLLHEINSSKKLQLYLIVAGMHLSKKYGYTVKEIKKDGFKIFAEVQMTPQGNSSFFMAKSLGLGIVEFSKIFKKIKPDINIILGDRDEAFASALAASHMNIPNAHIHGGDKTMAGIDEYIRHAITKISNIHFAATKKSKQRIIKLGENPKHVFFSGSPGIDEVLANKISSKIELEKKYKIKFTGNDILLLQHPVTTQIDSSSEQIKNILNAIVKLKKQTICIGPNSDAGNFEIIQHLKRFSKKYPFITFYSSLPRRDYLGFLQNCGVLVGNSSSGIIEGSYFKIPVVNIGMRQKDREKGNNVVDVPKYSTNLIHSSIQTALKIDKKYLDKSKFLYGDGNSSKNIISVLEKIKLTDDLIQKQITYP